MNGSPGNHLDRSALELADLLDRPIAFHRSFVTLTGSVNAALVLSQAVYWQQRISAEHDGWWYKTRTQWRDETGLTRREQETARKRLRNCGILTEERRGMPAKIWYRVNMEKLSEIPDRPIAFHRCIVGLVGSVSAALVLSQAIYWQKRVSAQHSGWWYKTRSQWTEETGLSRYEQESARKRLRAVGVVTEDKRGMPAKTWYRVDYPALMDLLSNTREDHMIMDPDGEDFDPNRPTIVNKTCSVNPMESNSWAHFPHLGSTNPPIKTDSPENHCWAGFPHLEWPKMSVPVIGPKIGCWADSPQQNRRWGKSAQQDGPNSPGINKETETTTETTPPPQTPPDSGQDRGGGEKVKSDCHAIAEITPETKTPRCEQALPNAPALIFPKALSDCERQAAQKLLAPCGEAGQEMLDVLAVIIRAGEVRKSPLAVLGGLVKRWQAGTFDASTGLHLAVAREQAGKIRQDFTVRNTARCSASKGNGPPPETLEAFRRLRRKVNHC